MNDLDSISTLHEVAQKRTKTRCKSGTKSGTRFRVRGKSSEILKTRFSVTNNVMFKFYEDSVTGNAFHRSWTRGNPNFTQQEAASRKAGVSPPAYLSISNEGVRPVTTELAVPSSQGIPPPTPTATLRVGEADFPSTLDESAVRSGTRCSTGYRASPTYAESPTTILLELLFLALDQDEPASIEGWVPRPFPLAGLTRIRAWIGSGSDATLPS